MNRRLAILLFLVVAGIALALRLPRLDLRPMHNDEAVNAILLQGLWERGEYRYDPDEYHGPALHYAALPFLRFGSAKNFDLLSERTLRQVTVVAGVLLILLLALLHDALGKGAALAAALLAALSPAMVFYSRYFIHEMLLAAFTTLLLGGVWRYLRSPGPGWAMAAGAGLGLMHATKETFVLTLAALGLGGFGAVLGSRRRVSGTGAGTGTEEPGLPGARWNSRHLALALGTALIVSVLLFTSFFANPRGPLDSVLTYLPWLRRAGGESPHVQPWHYYLGRLFWHAPVRGPFWSEGMIALLALAGGVAVATGRGLGTASRGFGRFLVIYTLAITGVYTLLSYKTPWCLLNFLLPLILLAGLGTVAVLRWAGKGPGGWVVGVLLAVGALHLGWQGWRASHDLVNHRGNPYAHSQTTPNVLELADRVKAIAATGPQGAFTEVRVVAPDSAYWPLPWYLRQLRNVGWLDRLPDAPYPPIVIAAAALHAALDEKTNRGHLSVGYYELRPREFFELFVEFELWKKYVATLPRPKDDDE